jgi:hypothetical protein
MTFRLANAVRILPSNIVVYGISFVVTRIFRIMYLNLFCYFQFCVNSMGFKDSMAMATEKTVNLDMTSSSEVNIYQPLRGT